MIKRPLGTSDMNITAIGVGAFAIGGWMWGGQDDAASEAAIRAALDAGVNWIDSAPIYGEGKASAVIGRVLKGMPAASRPLVFTKFGHHLVDGQRITDGSAAQVQRDCEEELQRLGVERIDLFQLHWPAPQPVEETAAACAALLKAGKIRAVGVSNFSAEQLAAWQATGLPLHSVQNGFSLVKPETGTAVLPWCVDHNVGFLAYSPLFRGLLSGTWTADKTFPAGDHRGERDDFRGPRLARWLQAVEEMRVLGEEDELTVPQLAIGWLLCHEGVSGVIVGARTAAQGAALGDLAMPLKQIQVDAIDAIVARCRADLDQRPSA
jgi:aryl-alcohol dehydrogenase-like predicted oxidoreductase